MKKRIRNNKKHNKINFPILSIIIILISILVGTLIFYNLNNPKLSPTSPVPNVCNGNEFGRYYVAEGSFIGNPLCSSSASPVWNGEMSGSCGWVPDNPLSSIGGKAWWTGNGGIMPSFTSDGKWTFRTRCCRGGLCWFTVWEGTKLLGDTPAGDYVKTSGSSPNIVHIKGCGDGIVQSEIPFKEQCDDSNSKNGDGCDACVLKPVVNSVSVNIDKISANANADERGGYIPTDNDINPYEDIECKAKVGTAGGEVPYVRLVSHDKDTGADLVITDWEYMDYVNTDSVTGLKNYNRRIGGWSNGWTQNNVAMTLLVNDIAKDPTSTKCEVRIGPDDSTKKSASFSASVCAHMWGVHNPGDIDIVTLAGTSASLSTLNIHQRSIDNYENGYYAIDPFMTYKNKFVQYTDLKPYDDTYFTEELPVYANYGGNLVIVRRLPYSTMATIPTLSNCKSGALYNSYSNKGILASGYIAGYTFRGSNTILLSPISDSFTPVHETGHALGHLVDEYIVVDRTDLMLQDNELNNLYNIFNGMNCKADGTEFAPYGNNIAGCSLPILKRSSVKSIMNSDTSNKFNVISCGYILKIWKANVPINQLWDECTHLDTIST